MREDDHDTQQFKDYLNDKLRSYINERFNDAIAVKPDSAQLLTYGEPHKKWKCSMELTRDGRFHHHCIVSLTYKRLEKPDGKIMTFGINYPQLHQDVREHFDLEQWGIKIWFQTRAIQGGVENYELYVLKKAQPVSQPVGDVQV